MRIPPCRRLLVEIVVHLTVPQALGIVSPKAGAVEIGRHHVNDLGVELVGMVPADGAASTMGSAQ